MIVDAHIHIRAPFDAASLRGEAGGRARHTLSLLKLGPTAVEEIEQRVKLMDRAGIDVAFIINAARHPSLGASESNDSYAELMARHPGRFQAVGGVQLSPRPDLTAFEHAIIDLGFRGIKVVPAIAYCRPDDFDLLDSFYRKAMDLDVPIMWHIGDIGLSMSRPIFASMNGLSEVVHRYPELKHLIAHLGGHGAPGVEETVIEFAASRRNVFIEASYAPRAAMMRCLPLEPAPPGDRYLSDFSYASQPFQPEIQAAWDEVKRGQIRLIQQAAAMCPDRFLFTTDTPLAISMHLGVDLYQEALKSSEVYEAVMSQNARRLFKF